MLLIFNILGYSRVFVNSLIAQHQYFYHVELSNHNRKYKIPSTFSQILFFAGVLASGTGKPQNTASQVRFLFVSGEIWWISFLCPFIVFILGRGGSFFLLCFHISPFWGHDRFPCCLFSQLGISAGLAQMPNHQNRTHGGE